VLFPEPRWMSIQRSPDHLAEVEGHTYEGKEGRKTKGKGRGRKREGMGRRLGIAHPLFSA